MKKIILLLMLPLAGLMAIDFVMTEEGLFAETPVAVASESTSILTPTSVTASGETSSYLEPVNLPECDSGNPEVQFIKSNADWNMINSSSKRIFCVSPGDYTSLGTIILNASGTVDKKRYIILNNGNDMHPGQLPKSQLANISFDLQAASYWVFDRMASFNVGFTHSFIINKNSTHNIFNRLFTQNVFHTMWVRENANYNTIQNSRFDGITQLGAEADLSAINLLPYDSVAYIYGTKILNNEFVNVTAFRANRYPELNQQATYDGTIFDNNTVEFNKDIRTDCNGNLNPDGSCIIGEAGIIGLKGGSGDPEKPIIISNNKAWGYRPADRNIGENLSNRGAFMTAYMGAKDVHVLDNVMFDGTNGIIIADSYDASRGTWDAVIKRNIIVECGARPNATTAFPMTISMAEGADVQDNLIKDSVGTYALRVSWNMYNNYVGNNDIIGSNTEITSQDNWETVGGIDTNSVYTASEVAGYTEDYVFTADRYTNSPREIVLRSVVKR